MKKLIPVLALSFLTGIVFTSCKPKETEPNRMFYFLYECQPCGWVYNVFEGYPEGGIAPDTEWEEIPDDFCCPECGSPKSDFMAFDVFERY